jgi:hypothetical protein
VAVEVFSDNAQTTINQVNGIGAADLTMVVASNTGFPTLNAAQPSPQYRVLVDSEEMIVTLQSGTTWTIVRGDGTPATTPAAHANGATVTHILNRNSIYNAFLTKVDEAILSAPVASVTFPFAVSAIPTTGRNLWLVYYARGDTAAVNVNLMVQLNADTGTNYDYETVFGSGAGLTAAETLGATSLQVAIISAASATTNYFGSGKMEFINFIGATGYKTINTYGGWSESNASGAGARISQSFGKWRTVGAALTSIKVFPSAGNLIAGSTFSLYEGS